MDEFLTGTIRRMQGKLEAISGFLVHYEHISDSEMLFTNAPGRYRFDQQEGCHIIGLHEEGDGFDELRAAMEISHGLLFFDGYPGVFIAPGGTEQVSALVTDTIHHPAMHSILSGYGLVQIFEAYYDDITQKWIENAELLSTEFNRNTDAKVRYIFFFLEALLVGDRFRIPLHNTFASRAWPTWNLADEIYTSVCPLYPVDQLRLRKAIIRCLHLVGELGLDTSVAVQRKWDS